MPHVEFKEYEPRHDLCYPHQSKLYRCADYGYIIRVKKGAKQPPGWYCTNDCRWSRVGEWPNEILAQPSLGPFKTAKEAHAAREIATVAYRAAK